MQQITDILQKILDKVTGFLDTYPLVEAWYTTIVRFVFPILAVLILAGMIRSLLNVPHSPEVWGKLALPGGEMVPLTHWENIVGRSAASDVVLSYPSISRQHAALMRAKDGRCMIWILPQVQRSIRFRLTVLPPFRMAIRLRSAAFRAFSYRSPLKSVLLSGNAAAVPDVRFHRGGR